MRTLLQDLRYGARVLSRQPGFTALTVLTLALGIGANTAVFSFVNSLFLQRLPARDPERVVRLYATDRSSQFDTFSYANFADLRARSRSFADLAAHQYADVSLNAGAGAEDARGELVTGNYFGVLGVNAALGRVLLPEDDAAPGASPVVVVSHGMWQRRFGADPGVAGKKVYLNGHPFTVVGVMPEAFKGTYGAFATDFWVPLMMHEQARPRGVKLENRGWGWLNGTGRLKEGVTVEQAQAELEVLGAQLSQEYPNVNRGVGFRLYPAGMLPEQYREGASKLLLFVMAVVGLVLLAACANAAGVLLSKVTARSQEIAVRQSLGATRARLARQWLTESLLLSFLGALAGLAVAAWVSEGLMALVPGEFTNFAPALGLDARVLAFTSSSALLTGLLCGLVPALRAGRRDLHPLLKGGNSSVVGGVGRSRVQQAFVVAQVAVSLVLLVVAGLLLRSLRESRALNPGFDTNNLLLVKLDLSRNGYTPEQGRDFYARLTERLKGLPGVRSATLAATTPLGPDREERGFRIPGHEPPQGDSVFRIAADIVGPDYFETMGIHVVRGRGFDRRESDANSRPVVVVNETMARQFWPGADPVGQTMQVGTRGPSVEIVGVVRDVKYYSVGEEPRPYVYGSFPQTYMANMTAHVRTEGDPRALFAAVRREVGAADANVAVTGLTTFEELRQVSLAPARAAGIVAGAFGALALVLAGVGLYGVISYSVGRRTREIGVRVALGARRADVFRLVVGQGLTLTLVGVCVGLAASFALTRFLSSLLYGVSATDPLTFAGSALLMASVALLACLVPARRATKVDPMVALRHE